MTLTTSGLSPFRYRVAPLTNTIPLTYRDGTTFQQLLERISLFLSQDLPKDIDGKLVNLVEQLNNAISDIETSLDLNISEITQSLNIRIDEFNREFIEYTESTNASISEQISVYQGMLDSFTSKTDETVDLISAKVDLINNKTGPTIVEYVTLTADTQLSVPPEAPSEHAYTFVITQDDIGGHKVSFDSSVVGDSFMPPGPGKSAEFVLVPLQNGKWVIRNGFTPSINVMDCGVNGDGVTDDSVLIQQIVDAFGENFVELIFPGREFRFERAVNLRSNTGIVGNRKSTIIISGNHHAFTFAEGASDWVIDKMGFRGGMPVDDIGINRSQRGISALSPASNPMRNVIITNCWFEGVEGSAILLKNANGFTVSNNKINRHGYAAIGCYSVTDGIIEGNSINGTRNFPSFSTNSYGIFVSTLEADGPVGTPENPRSSNVMVRNNRVKNQRWSALDTHVGQRISFIGNHISDCPASAINAVYISATAGHVDAQLAPEEIVISNNIIEYTKLQDDDPSLNMAILLRGSISSDAIQTRGRATGIIEGNIIRRYGKMNSSNSGGIFVGSGRGVIVRGNRMVECRSPGIQDSDSIGTVIEGNVFTDIWRVDSPASAVYIRRAIEPVVSATVTGNRYIRGKLTMPTDLPSGSYINTNGIGGSTDSSVQVLNANNEWEGAGFASTQVHYYTGSMRQRIGRGTAPPTEGSWAVGDRVENTVPAPNAPIGWVCTAGGSTPNWRPYGIIGS